MNVRELIEALQKLEPELPVGKVIGTSYDDMWANVIEVKVLPTEHFELVRGFFKEPAAHLILEDFE